MGTIRVKEPDSKAGQFGAIMVANEPGRWRVPALSIRFSEKGTPMNQQESIEAEMRLWALECLVSQLYAIIYQSTGDPMGSFEKRSALLLERARTMPFPGLDAAMSDLASGELEVAVKRLLGMQRELLEKGRGT